MFLTFAGMFIAFALAFVLACLDPIWKNKISLREGLAALLEKTQCYQGVSGRGAVAPNCLKTQHKIALDCFARRCDKGSSGKENICCSILKH